MDKTNAFTILPDDIVSSKPCMTWNQIEMLNGKATIDTDKYGGQILKVYDIPILAIYNGEIYAANNDYESTAAGIKISSEAPAYNNLSSTVINCVNEFLLASARENNITQQQKDYFKNSQLRDSNDKLCVCYHHTDADFNAFDISFLSTNSGDTGYFGNGFYFTSMETFGDRFGNDRFDCYINMQNPLIIDNMDKQDIEDLLTYMQQHHPGYGISEDVPKIQIEPEEDGNFHDDILNPTIFTSTNIHHGDWEMYSKQLSDWAKMRGYDGIVSEDPYACDGVREIVVFEPEQIKSVYNKYPVWSPVFTDNTKDYFSQDPRYKRGKAEIIEKLRASNIPYDQLLLQRYDNQMGHSEELNPHAKELSISQQKIMEKINREVNHSAKSQDMDR